MLPGWHSTHAKVTSVKDSESMLALAIERQHFYFSFVIDGYYAEFVGWPLHLPYMRPRFGPTFPDSLVRGACDGAEGYQHKDLRRVALRVLSALGMATRDAVVGHRHGGALGDFGFVDGMGDNWFGEVVCTAWSQAKRNLRRHGVRLLYVLSKDSRFYKSIVYDESRFMNNANGLLVLSTRDAPDSRYATIVNPWCDLGFFDLELSTDCQRNCPRPSHARDDYFNYTQAVNGVTEER